VRGARVGDSQASGEPFYTPDPDLFGHPDAFRQDTRYAAELEEAGLASRFPPEAEVRRIVIELLAEREAVEDLVAEPDLINDAIAEARGSWTSGEVSETAGILMIPR
jgi:hypothetical protein